MLPASRLCWPKSAMYSLLTVWKCYSQERSQHTSRSGLLNLGSCLGRPCDLQWEYRTQLCFQSGTRSTLFNRLFFRVAAVIRLVVIALVVVIVIVRTHIDVVHHDAEDLCADVNKQLPRAPHHA